MPLNDVMSPVLAAYFEGKRMREDRENKQQQQIFQQQKIEQENQRIKMEADQQKQQIKERADAFKELQQSHADIKEHNSRMYTLASANAKQAQATADSTAMRNFLAARYEGKFNPPSVPDSGPAETSEERPQRDILPFEVPGTEGRQVITKDMWGEPGSVQMARMMEQQRLLGERDKAKDKADLEQQNLRNYGMIAAALARRGGNGEGADPKTIYNVTKTINGQIEKVKSSQEAQKTLSSARAIQQVDDMWNRSYGAGKPLTGPDAVNLVMQYLQTVTPSNRITDFEFRKTADSDSSIAELKKRVENWVSSKKLTDGVARSLMGEIKGIHGANTKLYQERRNSEIESAKKFATANGVDVDTIQQMFDASEAQMGSTAYRPEKKEQTAPAKKKKTTSFGGREIVTE